MSHQKLTLLQFQITSKPQHIKKARKAFNNDFKKKIIKEF